MEILIYINQCTPYNQFIFIKQHVKSLTKTQHFNFITRFLCVKDNDYAEDQIVSLSDLGEIEYKEIAVQAPAPQEGEQHL